MYRISGYLQNYAWGIPAGLTDWQEPEAAEAADPATPQAELWYGAHQNGPSPLLDGSGTLKDKVSPPQAPILVKMLAAATPLSIQIHPPTDQAEATFAKQEADPSVPKLLADSLAKTEMLIAVKPFSVLQGLRSSELSAAILNKVGPELDSARHQVASGEIKEAIRTLLALDIPELSELTARVPQAASEVGIDQAGVEALELVARTYPGDQGVFVAALLGHRVMAPGEAVYVPAGVVHAYVEGTGVEVMVCSDNVLRLGLTPKAIAVDESLAALNPELSPLPMDGDPQESPGGGIHRHFAPSGAPFTVDWISDGNLRSRGGDYRLVLAVDGPVTINHVSGQLELNQGEAAAILADEPEVSVGARGAAAIARAVR